MATLVIFGDICPDNNFRNLFDSKAHGPFSDSIVKMLSDADAVIANLECPATESSKRIIKTGPNIKALPKDIALLKRCGITHLSLANNHILDYGEEGFCDTINACNENGIKYFGGGTNKNEAARHTIINLEGVKLGVLAYAEEEFNLATENTAGANHFDPYFSLDEIAEFKREVDYLIVLYHGGIEHYRYPSPDLQKKCRAMARKGADLVLIQHSHCIGTMEKIDKSTIVYGQGNSVFGYRDNDSSWNEGWVISLDSENLCPEFKLIKASKSGIDLANYNEHDSRFTEFCTDSEHLNEIEFISNNWDVFCERIKSLDLPLLYGYGKWATRVN